MDPWYKFPGLFFAIVVLIDCRMNPRTQVGYSIPDIFQFDSFYTRFHSDSAFQMSRIIFPLQGKPEQMDTLAHGDYYTWPKETWILHRLLDERDTTYEQNFQIIDSTLLREVIFHKSSGYRMERRYSFMDDGWHLIYYEPMRKPIRIEIN